MSGDPPSTVQVLTLVGQEVWLLPEGVAWHPASRTLFVADLHLGKAAAFRTRGLPVPSGTTGDNLRRLQALVSAWRAARVVFLGDLLHSARARQADVMEPLRQFRAANPALDGVLVRGNHDRHAGDPPADLGWQAVDEPWPVDGAPGLAACHHPCQLDDRFVLAGHWHPVVTLAGPARDRARLPCFCRIDGLLVLPAFGAFTGGSPVAPPPGAVCYAVGGGRVWPGLPVR